MIPTFAEHVKSYLQDPSRVVDLDSLKGIQTPEGIKRALRQMAQDEGLKIFERLKAFEILADVEGMRHGKQNTDLDRLSNEELLTLIPNVVIPALAAMGMQLAEVKTRSESHAQLVKLGLAKAEAEPPEQNPEVPLEMVKLCVLCKGRPANHPRSGMCHSCYTRERNFATGRTKSRRPLRTKKPEIAPGAPAPA